MKEVLEVIIKNLVNNKDAVEIKEVEKIDLWERKLPGVHF